MFSPTEQFPQHILSLLPLYNAQWWGYESLTAIVLVYLVYLTHCKICDQTKGYTDTNLTSLNDNANYPLKKEVFCESIWQASLELKVRMNRSATVHHDLLYLYMVNFNPTDYGYIVSWQSGLKHTKESILSVCDKPYHKINENMPLGEELKSMEY